MDVYDQVSPGWRIARRALFVVSAALVALALRLATGHPWLSVTFALLSLVALIPPYMMRHKFRKLLLSGDAERIASVWWTVAQRTPYPETTGPLIAATAFAAFGWVEQARAHLRRVCPGPAWESAREHRMFVETMLEVFDGDRSRAIEMAEAIVALPLPPVRGRLREQVVLLRASLAAFARAFARHYDVGDFGLLEMAARTSPLVSWAMRYAAAVIAVDQGWTEQARVLLADAPMWPEQSAFRAFHQELLARIAGAGPGAPSNKPEQR